jgi:serpin B
VASCLCARNFVRTKTQSHKEGKDVQPAALNFGDCFAFEVAKENGCPLLYVDDDFAKTDLVQSIFVALCLCARKCCSQEDAKNTLPNHIISVAYNFTQFSRQSSGELAMKSLLLTAAMLAFVVPSAATAGQDIEDEQVDPADAFIPAKIEADGKRIVDGLNRFGSEIYSKMMGEKGDLAISPASISTAFGLAYAGARGKTADDIAATLHYPTDIADFHKSYGQLLGTMQLSAKGRTMAVNNAIWLQHGLPVRDEYLALVDRNYGAGLNRVDYVGDPEAARLAINGWVESKTNDKIKELLTCDDITKDTRSVLVNTIYFKADWADPFDKAATKIEPFKVSSGKPVDLPLMHQRNSYNYAEQNGVQMLAMGYRGGETEMVILLPKARRLAAMEKKIANQGFTPWLSALDANDGADTIVSLPKFKIERRYGNVKDTLKAMGMVQPFKDDADFTAMKPVNLTSSDPNDWNLIISKVIHQVFVEVEEKGTEAAAATAIIMDVVVTGSRGKPPPPKIFRADHPFLFLIRDRRTGAILFVGRFTGEGKAAG